MRLLYILVVKGQGDYDMRLSIHFSSLKPRGFHKTSQTGINYDMRLLYILVVKGQGDYDMHLFIHFDSVKPRGFHKTS